MVESAPVLRFSSGRKVKEEDIVKALYGHFHFKNGSWVCFDHLRMGTGWVCERTVDFFALNTYQPYKTMCFEIKVSRADFMSELRKPEKRMAAQVMFDDFIFIAPKGILEPKDMPEGCGLWSVTEEGQIEEQRIRHKHVPKERLVTPGWPFIASILRKVYGHQEKQKQDAA